MKIELDLNARQVAAIRRQIAEPAIATAAAKRKTTENRRLYMRDLMRRRRCRCKGRVTGSNPP